jgi:NAD(P)-dependent dehydrogenase (short-subunit alcohol dehydrogenase family)
MNTTPRALVTGAASGLGLQAALQLAQRGCQVIVADRNVEGGEAAARLIREAGSSAEFRALDLASLSAIRSFADAEVSRGQPLDILLNNAGLLPPKSRTTTADGFELAFGVAFLGHFALTAQLLPALLRSRQPRVVTVSSNSHPQGRIDFDNLQLERRYLSSQAYTSSKLACLMFAVELARRATAAGTQLLSVAAHPGFAKTPIAQGWKAEGRRRLLDRFELYGYQLCMALLGQEPADGARSLVMAALEPGLEPGGYYGPTGFMQTQGPPGRVKESPKARDAQVARRLWQEAERLTGASWAVLGRAPA